MPSILLPLVKGLLAYILVWLTLQLIGNRQAGQATLLEVALAPAFVLLAGLAVVGPTLSLPTIAIAYGLWLGLFLVERYLLLRNRRARQSLQGEPTMLIYRGKLLEHNLYRKRLAPEQLLSKLRAQSIFDLADVEMAVLEPDGLLSVLRNPQAEPPTRQDMLIAGPDKGLPREVIVDGKIIYENLEQRGLSEKWLRDHLRAFNVEFVNEVALATVDDRGQLYVDTYKDKLDSIRSLHPMAGKADVRSFADAHPLHEKPLSSLELYLAERNLRNTEKNARPHGSEQTN